MGKMRRTFGMNIRVVAISAWKNIIPRGGEWGVRGDFREGLSESLFKIVILFPILLPSNRTTPGGNAFAPMRVETPGRFAANGIGTGTPVRAFRGQDFLRYGDVSRAGLPALRQDAMVDCRASSMPVCATNPAARNFSTSAMECARSPARLGA